MLNSDTQRLFAEGGMPDEGGTVDPVSGNQVPPGAMQEEVRDDIPAQLNANKNHSHLDQLRVNPMTVYLYSTVRKPMRVNE